jgi:uncharacterized protein
MIHKIAIENYYSIADRQELNFRVAENAPDEPCFMASKAQPNVRLPNVIGFFGPNASGKTTVLKAIAMLKVFIQASFNLPVHAPIPFVDPYWRNDWKGRLSKFLIEFETKLIGDEVALYRYELHFGHEFISEPPFHLCHVVYEAFSYAPKNRFKKIFERINQDISVGDDFGILVNDPVLEKVRPNSSVISTFAQFNHSLSLRIIQGLQLLGTNVPIDNMNLHPTPHSVIANYYLQNPSMLEKLNQETRIFDLGLENIMVQTNQSGPLLTSTHVGLDEPLIFQLESQGTQKFINIFPMLQTALDHGGVVVFDELDGALHPLMIPEIMRWFSNTDRNKFNAQLFFTAHNVSLLDDMEKEQVYFIHKPSGKPTEVYGAKDIKGLRREPRLMRKYMSGELGAVPIIG